MCHLTTKEAQEVLTLLKEEAVVHIVLLQDQTPSRLIPDHRLQVVHRAIIAAADVQAIPAVLRQVVLPILHQAVVVAAVVLLHILQVAHQARVEAMHLHHVQVRVEEAQVREDHIHHREDGKAS